MKSRVFWGVLCLILSFAVAATAQTPTETEGELYRIQPGDLLNIVVYGQSDLTVDVLVLPDGTISYPFAGTFQVRGLTADEVAEHLTSVLSTVVRVPVVSVQVRPGRGPSVVVLGEVRAPGVYTISEQQVSLLEAIARAGGPTASADLSQVRVYDRGNIRDYKEAPIGAEGVLFEGEAADNPLVVAGNIIYVPPAEAGNEIFVLGEVRSPGVYTLEPGRKARLLDIIARAGGPTASADLARVRVYDRGNIRDYREAPIGAEGVLFEGEAADNPVVVAGNIIYVPPAEAGNEIFVGEVRSPGVYTLEPGRKARLLDIIARRRGPTASADLARVRVYDRGNIRDYREAPIGAEGVLFEGEAADNPVVVVGNIIYVPPREEAGEIYILGEVRSPGAYTVQLGRQIRLMDIIARAGGPTAAADLARVRVYDRGNIRDYTEAPIGAEGILFEGEATDNPLVAVGNIIYVPPQPEAYDEIYVLGEVRSPGAYRVEPGRQVRLLDMIARAGGTTASADLARVKVYDRGNIRDYTEAPIGAEGVLFEGEAADNPVVSGGNIIYVPPMDAGGEIYVLGEVRSPGAYTVQLGRQIRLMDIIARAGGPTAAADLARVKVYDRGNIRNYTEAPIGAEGVLFDGPAADNPVVAVGNIIYVPRRVAQVTVIGPVARPGTYEIGPGERVLGLLGQVGGLQPEADASGIILRRELPSGEIMTRLLSFDRMLFGGSSDDNPVLQHGDIIFIRPTIQVAVSGEVRSNGVFRLKNTARVTDAILAAGGLSGNADMNAIAITRSTEQGVEVIVVDFEAILAGRAENILLMDGDIINVSRSAKAVYITGEVARPGVYAYTQEARLVDLVYQAGGPTAQADVENVVVYAEHWREQEVFSGSLYLNPLVEPGQTIYVPRRTMEVYVIGQAGRTGRIELARDSRILDLVAAIGGTEGGGNWRLVQVFRSEGDEGQVLTVDISAILNNPFSDDNIRLAEGDVVYVPVAETASVAVIGEVARPGTYTLSRNTRLIDALAAAGGVDGNAELERVSVLQAGQRIDVNLGRMNELDIDRLQETVQLQDGGIVVVPRTNRIRWQDVVTFLSGVRLIMDILEDLGN